MSVSVKEGSKNHNAKTEIQKNIGDGIPKAPGRIWMHEVRKKLTRRSNPHERQHNAAPSPADTLGTPATPVPPNQRPSITQTMNTQPLLRSPGADNNIGNVRSDPEATGPHIAVVPPRASLVDADDNTAPKSKIRHDPILRETTSLDLSSAIASGSRNATTVDDNAPAVRTEPDEQEGKNIGHGSKQEQIVLTQSASHENSQSQREHFAKRTVFTALEHCMKDYERMRIAIRVDMEDHKDTRRVCVTCFDGAVDRARDIENILFKNAKGLHGFSYVVRRKKDTLIFGFKGSDIDRIGDHSYNGHQTYTGNRSHSDRNNCPNEGGRPFSNTPYWTTGSTMVEVFCGDGTDGDIAGAPIRMENKSRDRSSTTSMWTCGGIVKVDGIDYGLTTAHPLVLGGPSRPRDSPAQWPSVGDTDVTEDLFMGNDIFGSDDDYFSAKEHPEKHWQAVGRVSHYALAKTGSLPRNNDWLLFELPKDRSMWSDFAKHTKSGSDTLAVTTARGTLAAHLLEDTAFLILGNSPFEVLKIELQEPLRPGDSGSWLMRGSELIGVMIAGSEEDSEKPIGYAISAQEVYRSISMSMGGLAVRPLTAFENAINKANQTGVSQHDLALLRIRQLFEVDAPVRRTKIFSDHHTLSSLANIQTGDAALTALLKLGFFCASIGLDAPTTRRSHFPVIPLWNRTKRIGEMLRLKMSQLSEGVIVTCLILALSASLPPIQARQRECARALAVLMEELKISPLPAQSHLRALVGSVCNRHTLPKPIDVHYGGPKETTSPTYLARSLGKALYAIRTNSFFVIEGVTARYLRKFLLAYTRYPVIAVNDDIADRLTNSSRTFGIVPRIFVASLDTREKPRFTQSNGPFWGEVVEFDELNDVLESPTTYWKAQRRAATRGEDGIE